MISGLNSFEKVVRKAKKISLVLPIDEDELHPFEERNVHPEIDSIVRRLFDDGHYSQATFEAYKYVDKKVQKLSKLSKNGFKLMMEAFSETSPLIKLTDLSNTSKIDEQQGYKFLFAGAIMAIRNPRGHEYGLIDSIDQCLDHISLGSLLLRRLDQREKI